MLGVAGLIPLLVAEAAGQIIATPNIEEFCRTAPASTYRRTLIYIDLASIGKDNTDWGLTILNKLELGAREPLSILSVNPLTFEVSQVFDSCYPTMTQAEIDEVRSTRTLWDKLVKLDPVDQQRENLQTFDARLRNSLDKLIANSVKLDPGKRRNVLGALAFDKNRFAERNAFYRAIIYTDGVILDPVLDTGTAEPQQITSLIQRYPASFSGAEVSVFGVVGSNDKDAPLESKERIFSAFFLNNWARLRSFSSSLPQQRNELFPPVTRIDGVFDGGGTQGSVKLAFTTAKGGILVDGWLAFVVGRSTLYVPFQESISARGKSAN